MLSCYHMIFNVRVKGWFFIVVFRAQFGAKARFQPGTITPLRLLAWGSCHWTSQGLDIAQQEAQQKLYRSCIQQHETHWNTILYAIMLFYVIFPSSETHLPEVSKSFLVAKLPGVKIDGFCHPRSGASVSGPPAMACLNGSIAVPPNMW